MATKPIKFLELHYTMTHFLSAGMMQTKCKLENAELRPRQTRTHCCGHIIANTKVSPFARARNICCGHKFCVRDTKNVSDFVQKRFVSATNVSQFAQPKIRHGQQCVLVYQGLYSSNYIQSKEIGNKKYYEEARELENWQYNLQSYPPSLYLEMPDRRLLAV